MRWSPIILCGWPGLARLWTKGHWTSLWIAIGFSLLINLALVSTFVWPLLLGENFPYFAWPLILVVWFSSAWVAYRSLPELLTVGSAPDELETERSDTLFIRAQGEYLKGNWDAAERLLARQLTDNHRDIQSRLLLATLFRHTRKMDLAREQISELGKFDESVHWDFEIQREKQLIELIEQQDPEDVLRGNNNYLSELSEDEVVLSDTARSDYITND